MQKAVVNQMDSRSLNSDHDLFFWCKVGFGNCFGDSSGPMTELSVFMGYKIHNPIKK